MRVLTNNLTDFANITCNIENPYYPFEVALKDTRLIYQGRTLAISGVILNLFFDTPVTSNYFAILKHNLTLSAVVTLEANDIDVWTAPLLSRTQTIADTIIEQFETDKTYQYWRIVIDDPTNTQLYLAIGKVYLGEYTQFPVFSLGYTFKPIINSIVSTNKQGITYGTGYPQMDTVSVDLLYINDTERKLIRNFLKTVDLLTPFILIFWDDDLITEGPLYCTLVTPPEFVRVDTSGLVWNTKLKFKETK